VQDSVTFKWVIIALVLDVRGYKLQLKLLSVVTMISILKMLSLLEPVIGSECATCIAVISSCLYEGKQYLMFVLGLKNMAVWKECPFYINRATFITKHTMAYLCVALQKNGRGVAV